MNVLLKHLEVSFFSFAMFFFSPLFNSLCKTRKQSHLNEQLGWEKEHFSINIKSQAKCRRRVMADKNVVYRFGTPVALPEFTKHSAYLKHLDLSQGQKQFLWGKANCYSVKNLCERNKQVTQKQLGFVYRKNVAKRSLPAKVKERLSSEYLKYTAVVQQK